ncbi:MAG: 30S ribosomal protein S3, partial [Clostridia bacterium]|nr:30S ribosomal protein S3 [Clostridia bacterium]
MGQKVHPKGLRIGIIKDWEAKWYADRDYSELLHEDLKIRRYLKETLYSAGVPKIEIERAANNIKIFLHTAS